MDSVMSDKRGFNGGMEEMRYPNKEYRNQNCQRKPDFIEDVLFQKDLYSSYNVIREEPTHEPTYTFSDAENSPSTECNPTSIFSDIDKQQPLVISEHGTISEPDCAYGADKGNFLLTMDPNVGEGVDLAFNDALQLTMDDAPMERTIDVSDYEVEPFIPVVQEGIITELGDNGMDEKWGFAELSLSDLPQLSMDAIQMESILETSDNEEVSFMQLDCDNLNIDLLSWIISGAGKDKVSKPIDPSIDQDSTVVDADNSAVRIVNNNAVPTKQTAEISGFFSDEANREAILCERNIDRDRVPVCTSPGNYKPSVEGQSCSKSRIDDSRDRNRRSRSRSRLHCRCRSPVKSSRYHSRRPQSRSVTGVSTNNHIRSQSQLKSGRYTKDHERRFYSTSSVSSRDGHRSSQSQLKSSERYSRDYSRRTRSRSTSVSHSRSSTNSRNADKSSRRPSHINSRDLQRPSFRRNQPKKRSSQHRNFE